MPISIITDTDKKKLYTQIYHLLGMPVRSIPLTEEQMDTFLELSIAEYEEHVNNWLIESQWSSLIGINVDEVSLTRAFSTRSLDYETQFTYAYSKIVGLQAGGDSILKKDFIELTGNTQMYQIPAGREINELLWFSRAELTDSIIDPYTLAFGGLNGGYAQMGSANSYFITPAFDLLLRMGDRNLKNRLMGGDLTYRITAGPAGTKWVHLMNVPGGRFDFSNTNKSKVWYWYYDTTEMDRDECLEKNKDIVRLPSDIEIDSLTWDKLNKPTQNWVRKYLIAFAKESLAKIFGRYSGDLKVPDAEVKLNYLSLETEAKDEKMKLNEELNLRLERLRPDKMLERKANEAESLNKALKFRALPIPIEVI